MDAWRRTRAIDDDVAAISVNGHFEGCANSPLLTPAAAAGTRAYGEAMAGHDFRTALDTSREIELTDTGRVSGKRTSRPVWFVREGGTLYLLPVSGSDTQWYRNVLRTPTIQLSAGDAEFIGTANTITDAAHVEQVIKDFGEKYGAADIERLYPNPNVAVRVAL